MADQSDADDWRFKCKNVTETFAEARKKALFIDVRFLVGEMRSGRYFSAHKMVLACGSPVFEAMFFGQLSEKKDPILIPDDDPEAFEVMLRYMYGESISLPSIVAACKSYFIADKYLIYPLQKIIRDYISTTNMDEENFWKIIEGNLYLCKPIEEKFSNYIELNAHKLLTTDKFCNVPEYILKMILQLEEMNASEFILLTATTKWGLKNFTLDTMYKLRDFLKNIRFSTLSPQQFCQFTENFPDVLDPSAYLKILKHLNDPQVYQLPYWCSTNKLKRNWRMPSLIRSELTSGSDTDSGAKQKLGSYA